MIQQWWCRFCVWKSKLQLQVTLHILLNASGHASNAIHKANSLASYRPDHPPPTADGDGGATAAHPPAPLSHLAAAAGMAGIVRQPRAPPGGQGPRHLPLHHPRQGRRQPRHGPRRPAPLVHMRRRPPAGQGLLPRPGVQARQRLPRAELPHCRSPLRREAAVQGVPVQPRHGAVRGGEPGPHQAHRQHHRRQEPAEPSLRARRGGVRPEDAPAAAARGSRGRRGARGRRPCPARAGCGVAARRQQVPALPSEARRGGGRLRRGPAVPHPGLGGRGPHVDAGVHRAPPQERQPAVLHPGAGRRRQPGPSAALGVRAGHRRRRAVHQGAVHRAPAGRVPPGCPGVRQGPGAQRRQGSRSGAVRALLQVQHAGEHAPRLRRAGHCIGARGREELDVCRQQHDGGRERPDGVPRVRRDEGGEGRGPRRGGGGGRRVPDGEPPAAVRPGEEAARVCQGAVFYGVQQLQLHQDPVECATKHQK